MFGIGSGTATDYHELNAGAHRKPPKVLSAPSLIWHLSFWTSFQELGQNGKPVLKDGKIPTKKKPADIKKTLDRYIVALYHAIAGNGEGKTTRSN
jgi:hypothetical protein